MNVFASRFMKFIRSPYKTMLIGTSKTKAMDHLSEFLRLVAKEERQVLAGKSKKDTFSVEVTMIGMIVTKIMANAVKIKPTERVGWLTAVAEIAGIDPEVINDDTKSISLTVCEKGIDMDPWLKMLDNYSASVRQGLSVLLVASNNDRLSVLMGKAKDILAEDEEYEGAKRAAEAEKILKKTEDAKAMFFNLG